MSRRVFVDLVGGNKRNSRDSQPHLCLTTPPGIKGLRWVVSAGVDSIYLPFAVLSSDLSLSARKVDGIGLVSRLVVTCGVQGHQSPEKSDIHISGSSCFHSN